MPSKPTIRFSIFSSSGEQIIAALASDTARAIYRNILEAPKSPIEIADELDLSVQSVHYHIRNLEKTQLIRETDIEYSEKGIEMTVYEGAPVELVCPPPGDSVYSMRSN